MTKILSPDQNGILKVLETWQDKIVCKFPLEQEEIETIKKIIKGRGRGDLTPFSRDHEEVGHAKNTLKMLKGRHQPKDFNRIAFPSLRSDQCRAFFSPIKAKEVKRK